MDSKMQQFKIYFEAEQEVRRVNVPLPSVTGVYAVVHQKIVDVLGHASFRVTWKG